MSSAPRHLLVVLADLDANGALGHRGQARVPLQHGGDVLLPTERDSRVRAARRAEVEIEGEEVRREGTTTGSGGHWGGGGGGAAADLEVHAVEASLGEHGGVDDALLQLLEPGLHVPAEVDALERRVDRVQLRLPPERGGTDDAAVRQVLPPTRHAARVSASTLTARAVRRSYGQARYALAAEGGRRRPQSPGCAQTPPLPLS